MSDIIMGILSEEAYLSIFTEDNQINYHNYLAMVHHELKAYKNSGMNFIEYHLDKKHVDETAKKLNIENADFKKNMDMLLEFDLDESKKGKVAIPKVPDYLLKVMETFTLPLTFVVEDINDIQLFNSIELETRTLEKIKKVFNQYLFSNDKFEELGSHICEGQQTHISPHLLSFNTYKESVYDAVFETSILDNKSLTYRNSKYDELFISNSNNTHFTIKNLTILFEGSLYEYRNFLLSNPSFLTNIIRVINDDINEKYNGKILVQQAIDRFVVSANLTMSYVSLIEHYLHMNLFQDKKVENYNFPNDLETIDSESVSTHKDYVLISHFEKTEKEQNKKSKTKIENKSNNDIDIDRLRKIHEKKFPNQPFIYDEGE